MRIENPFEDDLLEQDNAKSNLYIFARTAHVKIRLLYQFKQFLDTKKNMRIFLHEGNISLELVDNKSTSKCPMMIVDKDDIIEKYIGDDHKSTWYWAFNKLRQTIPPLKETVCCTYPQKKGYCIKSNTKEIWLSNFDEVFMGHNSSVRDGHVMANEDGSGLTIIFDLVQ